jgi:hypothetical protein
MTEQQQRFLNAYAADPRIAPAARAARVHRASVYRWQADPVFAVAMKAASQAFYAAVAIRYAAQQELVSRQRAARNAELLPRRQAVAAHARLVLAAKRRLRTLGMHVTESVTPSVTPPASRL